MCRISTYRQLLKQVLVAASLAASLLIVNAAQAATSAGKVVFTTGVAKAINSSGSARTLRRGDDVFSGDKLQTAARSRLQVSLADGAYISVQPDSEYLIEDYHYNGKADGSEKAFYRLLKGGIRAVTGFIGKKNRDAYKVHTAVATIGIRGTGHNTRICAGDCPGRKDGLYHNTWEGITTVGNDRDNTEVPAGRGVFVKDINSSIKSTSQPSGATALETAKQSEEEQQEEEESTGLASSAEQRGGEEGLQTVVVENREVRAALDNPFGDPTSSTVIANRVVQAVGPNINTGDFDSDATALEDTYVFKNAAGHPIAFFGLEEDDDDDNPTGVTRLFQTFATIDPAAALGADDADLVEKIKPFLNVADRDTVDAFLLNPAEVAEFHSTPEGLSLGRWSGGHILSMHKDTQTGEFEDASIEELVDFQSIHFIYGETADPIPTTGAAVYNFTAGTQSTSNSGASIGNGAIAGYIAVNFATADAAINLDVDHNSSLYSIYGGLLLDGEYIFDQGGVIAIGGDMGGACYSACTTVIDGGFAGPAPASMPGMPNNIGIEYEIHETDIITGVAGFSYQTVGP